MPLRTHGGHSTWIMSLQLFMFAWQRHMVIHAWTITLIYKQPIFYHKNFVINNGNKSLDHSAALSTFVLGLWFPESMSIDAIHWYTNWCLSNYKKLRPMLVLSAINIAQKCQTQSSSKQHLLAHHHKKFNYRHIIWLQSYCTYWSTPKLFIVNLCVQR